MALDAFDASPTDEELRKLLKPNPSHDEVIQAVKSIYGLSDVHIVKDLESYDDRNYLVRNGESSYLVKIHNGVESSQFLRSNFQFQELSEKLIGDGGIQECTAHTPSSSHAHSYNGISSSNVNLQTSPASSPISSKTNTSPLDISFLGSADYAKVVFSLSTNHRGVSSIDLQNYIFEKLKEPKYKIKASIPIYIATDNANELSHTAVLKLFPVVSPNYSPCRLVMRLLRWVEGTPMSACIPMSIETLAQAGVYLGNLCHALDDLTRENHLAVLSSTRYHAWDGKYTLDLEKFTHFIQDPQRRSLVTSVIDAFREDMDMKTQQNFRCGILHGDFNDANIILNGKGYVDGVIDFGDSTYRYDYTNQRRDFNI